jgi:hypothetical protein
MTRYRTHARARRPIASAIAIVLVTALFGSTLRAAPAPVAPAQIPGIANGPPLTVGENAEETYELNFVGLKHTEWGGYRGANGTYVPRQEMWEGFRGKYRLKLGVIEFYDAVARPDLHVAATHRVILTTSLLITAAGLAVVGGYYTIHGAYEDPRHSIPKLPAAAFLTGGILILVCKALTFQPTTEAEAYGLARTYNDNLRARLGLPPLVEDPTEPVVSRRPIRRRVALVPAIGQQGGGLMLMGLF